MLRMMMPGLPSKCPLIKSLVLSLHVWNPDECWQGFTRRVIINTSQLSMPLTDHSLVMSVFYISIFIVYDMFVLILVYIWHIHEWMVYIYIIHYHLSIHGVYTYVYIPVTYPKPEVPLCTCGCRVLTHSSFCPNHCPSRVAIGGRRWRRRDHAVGEVVVGMMKVPYENLSNLNHYSLVSLIHV